MILRKKIAFGPEERTLPSRQCKSSYTRSRYGNFFLIGLQIATSSAIFSRFSIQCLFTVSKLGEMAWLKRICLQRCSLRPNKSLFCGPRQIALLVSITIEYHILKQWFLLYSNIFKITLYKFVNFPNFIEDSFKQPTLLTIVYIPISADMSKFLFRIFTLIQIRAFWMQYSTHRKWAKYSEIRGKRGNSV